MYISPYFSVNQWFLYIFVDKERTKIEDNVPLSTKENSDDDNFEVEDELLLSIEENSDDDNFKVEEEHDHVPDWVYIGWTLGERSVYFGDRGA